MRTVLPFAVLAGAAVAALVTPAEAIIRRHDVADQAYLDFGAESQFAPVGRVLYDSGGSTFWNGSGTLIGDRWVLTAAHVVDGAASYSFDFGGGTERYLAQSVHLHPGWGNGIGFEGAADMALIELDRPVTGYTPAALASGATAPGSLAALVGYGGAGDGVNGWNGGYDVLRRAGTNVVEPLHNSFAPDILTFDFDAPGATGATSMESMIMFGDSGGAVMAIVDGGWELIGVHSFIASAGDPYGVYGDYSGSTAVWDYMPWINSVVPAPSGVGVLGLGLLFAARRRR